MSTKLKVIFAFIALLIIGYLASVFYIAVKHDNHDDDMKQSLEQLQKERDSIQLVYDVAIKREQAYILAAEQDSIRAAEGEKKVAALEKKTKTYAYRLKEMEALVISQPDSFLIKRYPD